MRKEKDVKNILNSWRYSPEFSLTKYFISGGLLGLPWQIELIVEYNGCSNCL